MRVVTQVFSLQKAGNAPEEYEDSYWPTLALDDDYPLVRLAVTDGATETSFSGLWAQILAEAYGQRCFGEGFDQAELDPLQNAWRERTGSGPLPWYAEAKLSLGAYSTLAGLEIRDGGEWNAVAVGDSCLFHLRSDQLLQSFPLERADQFDSRPWLISSSKTGNRDIASAVKRCRGSWITGDLFLLMTDALACHFLRLWDSADDRHELLSIFCDLQDNEAFASRMSAEREEVDRNSSPALRNDDVTLVRCRVLGQ